ncbi:glycosyltransferase family 9 protein [Limibacter armeniacum]|uniref:glycosyltransferase family 9 protein n=1 Tax=Limibacter armeniacum TaxID=466084 RepID=UPI002FE620E4
MKKVLIIRFSSIGDIVLTTPVIRTLKTQLEGVEVHYCTKKGYKGILEHNPYVDKLHLFDGDLGELVKQLKDEKFDFVVDLHNNLRTSIIKTRLGVKSKAFNKLNWEKWLYVNMKIDKMPNVHIVDRYMEAVKPLGVKMDALGLDYFIPEKDEVELTWLPESHREKYVVYAIGGQHATKQLPFEKMVELCDKIQQPIMLLGGPEDKELGDKIVAFFDQTKGDPSYNEGLEKLKKNKLVFNGCGKFNLNQSASVVKQAYAVFTHDTGMMHIAAAFKKNIYSIWGNTTPQLGMYPYRTQFTVFENTKLDCRPCSKIGYSKCPKGHFKCMNDQQFDFYLP